VVAFTDPLNATVAPLPLADGLIVPEMLYVVTTLSAGRISQMLRLYRSVVGAVSFIVTVEPLTAVDEVCLCTQYVSPAAERN
jgi:hypothetical protein